MKTGRTIGAALASLTLTTIAAPTPALAQQASGSETESEEAEDDIVVTAERNRSQVLREGNVGILGNQAAENVPFIVKSYNSALILNQQPQTLGQVLENDPSIRVTNAFGTAAEVFVLRGFPLFADDIGFNGLYGLTPRQLVAPELYEQVQVLNGASAFLNGAAPGGSGIGGSVNLVPKRAGTRDISWVTLNYTGVSHIGAAFDVGRRFADGAVGVRINGASRGGDLTIRDEFRTAQVLGGSFDWHSGRARATLDLGYQHQQVRQLRHKVAISTVIPEVPGARTNYAQPWQFATQRDVFGTLAGEFDVADRVTLYGQIGARDGWEESIAINAVNLTDAASGAAIGNNAQFTPRTDSNEAAQVGLRAGFDTFGISHQLNVGGSSNWQVNRNAYQRYAAYPTNIYDPVPVPRPAENTVRGGDLDDPFPIVRTRLRSLFLSDTLGAFGDRVLLTGGLRYQEIRVIRYAYFATGGLAAGDEQSRYDENAITPVIGLVVKPFAGISLYANRIEGLVQGPQAPNQPGLIVNANEVFPPFRSVQYEAGGKLTLGPVAASLAAYQTEQPNAFAGPIVPVPATGPTLLFAIDGLQRNRGLEFSLDGELLRGLRLISGAAVNDAKLVRTAGGVNQGNKVPGVPDYTINANAEWDVVGLGGLTLTGRVLHTGPQMVNQANTLELGSWTRFDLGARYLASVGGTPVTLRANVDNVANRRFWASAFNSFAFDTSLLQGIPRTVKLSVTVEF